MVKLMGNSSQIRKDVLGNVVLFTPMDNKSKAECFKMIGYSTHYHFYRTPNYIGLSVWNITPSILKENTQPIHIQHPTETLILSDHIL